MGRGDRTVVGLRGVGSGGGDGSGGSCGISNGRRSGGTRPNRVPMCGVLRAEEPGDGVANSAAAAAPKMWVWARGLGVGFCAAGRCAVSRFAERMFLARCMKSTSRRWPSALAGAKPVKGPLGMPNSRSKRSS